MGRRWADFVGRVEKFFKEKKWQFRWHILRGDLIFILYYEFAIISCNMVYVSPCSKTGASERAMVIGLGGLNLFGVIILGTMLK